MPELPDNNGGEARRWLSNVDDDLRSAQAALADDAFPSRIVCFLAHLVVEKALKASLIDAGIPFKKTHNLLVLHESCASVGRLEALDTSLLAACNPWAADGRYADDLVDADSELAATLTAFAEQVVAAVREELEAE